MRLARFKCLSGFVFGLLLAAQVWAQTVRTPNADQPGNNPPVTAEKETVEENPYFKVFRLQIPAGTTKTFEFHERDAVLVSLGENLGLITYKPYESASLENGDVRFLPIGSVVHLLNTGNSAVFALIAELKQHWEPPMRTCSEPAKCAHPIRMGESVIGETTSLFTNGFVTAYQHRIDPGATLESSYFSAKGKDHLLLIALTDLNGNFDGSDESLKAGQTYTSEATEVEVNAGKSPTRWIVLRMETLSH